MEISELCRTFVVLISRNFYALFFFDFLVHYGPPLEILETTIDDNISEEGGSGGGAMPIGIDVSDSDIGTIGLANTCTDKYLRTLQKIAKQNAETGQFKTSLPKDQVLVIGQNISSTHGESKITDITSNQKSAKKNREINFHKVF